MPFTVIKTQQVYTCAHKIGKYEFISPQLFIYIIQSQNCPQHRIRCLPLKARSQRVKNVLLDAGDVVFPVLVLELNPFMLK